MTPVARNRVELRTARQQLPDRSNPPLLYFVLGDPRASLIPLLEEAADVISVPGSLGEAAVPECSLSINRDQIGTNCTGNSCACIRTR
jgi:hypothetical protein